MTRFYIIRHGQSEGNANRVFLGHTDLDITELGHEQAKRTAEYLKDKKIDVIYSSDLKRAYNTAMYLSRLIGVEIKISENLREIYAGLWEGRELSYIVENYNSYDDWRNNFGIARPDGGESTMELQKRIEKELVRIAEENDGKTVAVAIHAAAILSMTALWQGRELSDFKVPEWVANASVTDVCYDNGKWILNSLGYDKHLSGMVTKTMLDAQ